MRVERPEPPSVLDVVLSGLFGVVLGPLSVLLGGIVPGWSGPIVGVIAAALTSAAMIGAALVARTRPGLSLGLAWAGAVLQMGAGLLPLPVSIAVFAPLFWTGASADRRLRIAGIVSAVAGALVMTAYLLAPVVVVNPEPAFISAAVLLVAGLVSFVLAWTLGLLWSTSRTARREREDAIVHAERSRIAREMHDVVAHSLAVVIAQADGARYASAADPERAREGLVTVAGVAREALGEVRTLLAGLRHDQGSVPQPGLDDLATVVAAVREAGLDVRFDGGTPPESVPAGLQLAVHRIVQESLTNALRHGRADRPAEVRIAWSTGEVRVRVESEIDPARPPSGSAGQGIMGMRERARIAGGALVIDEDVDGRRFVVDAVLPLAGPPMLQEAG